MSDFTTVITKENYEEEVTKSEKLVLIDFWAPWCGPCRAIAPTLDEIAEEIKTVKVCKVNVDQVPDVASKFNVMSIPTLVVIKNGKLINTVVGVKTKAEILEMLQV